MVNLVGQLIGIHGYLVSVVAGQVNLQDHHTDKLQHGYKLAGIIANSHMLQAVSTKADDQGTQNDLR